LGTIPGIDQIYGIRNSQNITIPGGFSVSPLEKIVNAVPGEPATFGPFVLMAADGYYFTETYQPSVMSTRYNTGQNQRQSNIEVDNWSVTGNTSVYNSTTQQTEQKPGQLTLYIKDSNFADGSSTGLGSKTDINMAVSTTPKVVESPYEDVPYIRGIGGSWTGGRVGWNSQNINHYNMESGSNTGVYPNRTVTIENFTSEQVNIRIKTGRSSQASVDTFATIKSQVDPMNSYVTEIYASTQNGLLISGSNQLVGFSGSTLPIPAGGEIEIEWSGVSPQNYDNDWDVTLQYYVGTTEPTNHSMYNDETQLTYLAY
jgi:hypothetical protein